MPHVCGTFLHLGMLVVSAVSRIHESHFKIMLVPILCFYHTSYVHVYIKCKFSCEIVNFAALNILI